MSPSWRASILKLSMALAAILSPPAPAQDIDSRVSRDGEFITVRAVVDLPVQRQAVWDVLTDYDNLAAFIPDVNHSRVIARQPGTGLVLEQRGRFGFLFFSMDIDVRLAVVESAPHSVESRLLSGNLRDLSGRYDLTDIPGGVRLAYRGRLLPETALPPVIGTALVRRALDRHFAAMVAEILRRAALPPAGSADPVNPANAAPAGSPPRRPGAPLS